MTRRRRSKWPFIVFLLLAAGGGWWYWSRADKKEGGPEYETAAITRGDVTKVVQATGQLNPLLKVEIGSQISGTIAKLTVDFNSKVKKGALLCQLDPATYEANRQQAAADQATAQAEFAFQKRNLERKRQLLEKKVFPQAEYDKTESDFRRAEAQVLATAARMKKAQVDLDRCSIYAPIDGVIVDRTAEIGQTIAASFSAPKLFVLANDLTKMQINARVSEAHIGQVLAGQKVDFTVQAYPDTFSGEVVQVRNSPIIEENVVNYDTIIAVSNPDLKLRPGMNAIASIVVGERKSVLLVPNGALRFKPPSKSAADASPWPAPPVPVTKSNEPIGQKQIYLAPATPGAEAAPVKIMCGLSDGLLTEVLSGVEEGVSVVTMLKPAANAVAPATNPFGGPGRR